MMKRSIFTIFVLCMIFAFAGCDGDLGDIFNIDSGSKSSKNWLCFTSNEDNSTITTKLTENPGTLTEPIPVIEYSIDNGASWKAFTFNIYEYSTGHLISEGVTVTLAQGEKVYL